MVPMMSVRLLLNHNNASAFQITGE